MAVNGENAGGGQVVTVPRNDFASVLPAVIFNSFDHVPGATRQRIKDFPLKAPAIEGGL